MKKAVVDVDAILWAMAPAWHKELIKINPSCPFPGSTREWTFHKGFMSDEDFMSTIDQIHMSQYKYPCFPEASALAEILYRHGYEVIIASHRSSTSYNATKTWLKQNNIYFDKLYCVKSKHFLLEDASIIVDDAPHTQDKATKLGVTTFSIKYPYNGANNKVNFYKNLKELVDGLENYLTAGSINGKRGTDDLLNCYVHYYQGRN